MSQKKLMRTSLGASESKERSKDEPHSSEVPGQHDPRRLTNTRTILGGRQMQPQFSEGPTATVNNCKVTRPPHPAQRNRKPQSHSSLWLWSLRLCPWHPPAPDRCFSPHYPLRPLQTRTRAFSLCPDLQVNSPDLPVFL